MSFNRKIVSTSLIAIVITLVSMVSSAFASTDDQATFEEVSTPEVISGVQREHSAIMLNNVDNTNTSPALFNSALADAQSLPFGFSFDFSSNLTSRTFTTTKTTVKIDIFDACWKTTAGDSSNLLIKLYSGDGVLLGYTQANIPCDGITSYDTFTFSDVPKGDIYFVLSKAASTYNYYMIGSGRIYN